MADNKHTYTAPSEPPPNYGAQKQTEHHDAGPWHPGSTASPAPNNTNQMSPYNQGGDMMRAPDQAYGGYQQYNGPPQQGYYGQGQGPPPQGYYGQQGPQGPQGPQGMYYQQQQGPMYGQPQQGYYQQPQKSGGGAGGICAGVMGALACCCCLDMLF